jgi:hypothetical protein
MTTAESPKNAKEHAERLDALLNSLFDDTTLESTALASQEIFRLMEATFKWLGNPDANPSVKQIIEKLPEDVQAKLKSAETKTIASTSLEALADLDDLKRELEQTPLAPALDLIIVRMLFLSQMFFGLNPGTMLLHSLAVRGEKAKGGSSKGGATRAVNLNWWQVLAEKHFDLDPLATTTKGEALGRQYADLIAADDELNRRPKHRPLVTFLLRLQREKRAAI